jgi:hypothetical protein
MVHVRPWPVVRALLITFAIVIGLVDGCPLPPVKRVPKGTVRDTVSALTRAQKAFGQQFYFIKNNAKIVQRWKLFPFANEDRFRITIEGRKRNEEWALLFRPHDDNADFMNEELVYRRIRGAWNPGSKGARSAYQHFVSWVAREMLARRPDLDEIRVRVEKIKILQEARGFVGTGEYKHTEVRTRQQVALRPSPAGPPLRPSAPVPAVQP